MYLSTYVIGIILQTGSRNLSMDFVQVLVKSAFLRKFEKEDTEGARFPRGLKDRQFCKVQEWNFLDSKPRPQFIEAHAGCAKVAREHPSACRLSHWIENLEQVIKFLGEQKNKTEAGRTAESPSGMPDKHFDFQALTA